MHVTTPPHRLLSSGHAMPLVGLGTFGSDRYGPDDVSAAVRTGIDVGYRLIDCASVYGNEAHIGLVLEEALAKRSREEFFVMSKVWNDAHSPQRAVASVERSLRDLRLDYLDAVFVHWPFPAAHPPKAETDARDPDATPYDHARYLGVWQALEGLVDRGLVRHLGTSNTTIPKLELLLRDARIAPTLNEMELHPCFQQPELFRFCVDNSIQPVGYSPLGSPSRPERDRDPEDVIDLEHPVVVDVAQAHGVHPAVICLAWAVTRGQVPIPFSVKREQLEANLRGALETVLSASDIDRLRGAERNARLIKGQVFLWQDAESWLELWDVDGTIPGHEGYAS